MENFLFEGMVSIVQMLVFTIYLKNMLGLRRSVYWMPVCWGVIDVIGRIVISIADSTGIKGITYLLLIEIIVFWMCNGTWRKKLVLILAYAASAMVLEVILIGIIIIAGVYNLEIIVNNIRISCLISILTQILLFIFFQIVDYCCRYRINGEIHIRNWLGIFFVYAGCFAGEIILIVHIVNRNNFSIEEIFVLAILICLNFFCYYFYSVSVEKYRMELKIAVYQEQINMYQERYQSILQTRKEIEGFQHDINNHFGILQKLCQKGTEGEKSEECMGEIAKYLENIGIVYDKAFHDVNSENLMIDSVIDMKKAYAISKGIEVKTELYIPSDMIYDSLDLVVILGNLLDNAIEACEKLTVGKKTEIILKIKYRMSNLVIHVENTCESSKEQSGSSIEDSLPQTTKESKKMHGIGMKNVKKVVEKYNGLIEWRSEQGIFSVDVLLFGFDKKKIEEVQES